MEIKRIKTKQNKTKTKQTTAVLAIYQKYSV